MPPGLNDDAPGGGCGLRSRITGVFVPAPGDYLLTVSPYNWDALDAAGEPIRNNTPYDTERAPDGPGAPGPVATWAVNVYDEGPYSIFIEGAEFRTSTPVQDATWGSIKALYR